MNLPARGPLRPAELAYRTGYGVVTLVDRCRSLWGSIEPGEDEAVPPVLALGYLDLELYLTQLGRSAGRTRSVVTRSRELLECVRQAWAEYERAWASPEHAELARAIEDTDSIFEEDLREASRTTLQPIWESVNEKLAAFVDRASEPYKASTQLGMYRAALTPMFGPGLSRKGWLTYPDLERPISGLQAVLQRLGRSLGDRLTTDLDLSGDSYRRNCANVHEGYVDWVKRRSDELLGEVIAVISGQPCANGPPPPTLAGRMFVQIEVPDTRNVILRASSGLVCDIESKDEAVLRLLAENVREGNVAVPVAWRYLNTVAERTSLRGRRQGDQNSGSGRGGDDEPDGGVESTDDSTSASALFRKRLQRLNQYVLKRLGPPPDHGAWFVSDAGRGLRLNPSVEWVISEARDGASRGQSVFVHNVDQDVLEEVVPDHGQKLPPRNPRPGPADPERDDD